MTDPVRSRTARLAAETSLVAVAHHFGERPDFVLLGGLVPEFLCGGSSARHAGTIDVDVQVDLAVAAGSVHAPRLENALERSGFRPESERVWRWIAMVFGTPTVVKFELLTDQPDVADGAVIRFRDCRMLGAANLRGTSFASLNRESRRVTASVDGQWRTVDVFVAGLAGFLLAKVVAARARRAPKDWYDIAFVLLHNDAGGPRGAGAAVLRQFGHTLKGEIRSALTDLGANFATPADQGPAAYAEQLCLDHPEIPMEVAAADAVTAVQVFLAGLAVR